MKIISFTVPYKCLVEVDSFLEKYEVEAVSIFEKPESGYSTNIQDSNGFPAANRYIVEIYSKNMNLLDCISKKFTQDFTVENVTNSDWVNKYTSELKPIIIDDYFIYNDNYSFTDSSNLIPIKINSALAFGSGDHQTTKSCISMLSYIKNKITPKSILDMGCGSGILGICAGKIWGDSAKITAIDIDDEAVKVAEKNFKENVVPVHMRCASSITGDKKYDLILCNILKKPLEDLAPSFCSALNIGGMIIISGFITSQYNEINLLYKNLGFSLVHRIQEDEWLALLYHKK
jgi:ribosomal protein L11 methyltransferase